MSKTYLVLYGRKGCCLCAALLEKLESISLKDIEPSVELYTLDIDSDLSTPEKIKYELEVPVLFIKHSNNSKMIELPRVSPRMNKDSLANWLKSIVKKTLEI